MQLFLTVVAAENPRREAVRRGTRDVLQAVHPTSQASPRTQADSLMKSGNQREYLRTPVQANGQQNGSVGGRQKFQVELEDLNKASQINRKLVVRRLNSGFKPDIFACKVGLESVGTGFNEWGPKYTARQRPDKRCAPQLLHSNFNPDNCTIIHRSTTYSMRLTLYSRYF